jgi:hypothetical protein
MFTVAVRNDITNVVKRGKNGTGEKLYRKVIVGLGYLVL